MRRPALLAPLALSACTGGMMAEVMPGETVTVNGLPFTVQDTPRGLVVQNFETGRTNPAVIMAAAGQAAEQVSGCPLNTIVKDGISNTYYVSVSCPEQG